MSTASGPTLFALAALAYLALAVYVIWLNDPDRVGAGFWPAAGIMLALLLLVPTRRWWWIVAGIIAGEVVSDVYHGYPVPGIPWWVAGNVINPLLGAYLVRRFGSPRGELVPVGNLLVFVLFGVIIAPTVGASVGTVGTVTQVGVPFVEAWPKYVVGDALGVLVMAPVILTAGTRAPRRPSLEWIVLGAGLIATAGATAWDWPGSLEVTMPALVIPFLTWAALRFGVRGAAWAVFIVAHLTNLVTALGRGPFVDLATTGAEAVWVLQAFLLLAASSTFVLAAIASELSNREQVEQLLHDLADSMPQLVWVAGADGAVTYYNRRREAYAPPTPGEPFAWHPLLHPDDEERTAGEWARATRTGEAYECEHRLLMADGSYRWHLSRAERVEAMGRAQWYGTATDIDELKRADALKDEFVAIASHELRNPVAAIYGLAQQFQRAIDRKQLDDQRIQAYSGGLLQSSSYLARLTNDLMDVSRLQRSDLPIHPETVDIAGLLTAVASSLEWPEGRVRAELEEDLGRLEVDPARMRQVLSNLIDNALKYSPEDGLVVVRARPRDGGVLVEVEDSGIGLPEEDLERIFSPFGRATNAGTVHGLGMGLYIAREIAERHGGSLVATSPGIGHGSTMRLWLPRATTTGVESPPGDAPPTSAGAVRSGSA